MGVESGRANEREGSRPTALGAAAMPARGGEVGGEAVCVVISFVCSTRVGIVGIDNVVGVSVVVGVANTEDEDCSVATSYRDVVAVADMREEARVCIHIHGK
jgi:hypothetical protein